MKARARRRDTAGREATRGAPGAGDDPGRARTHTPSARTTDTLDGCGTTTGPRALRAESPRVEEAAAARPVLPLGAGAAPAQIPRAVPPGAGLHRRHRLPERPHQRG